MTCRLREVIRRRCLERAVPAPAARVYLIVCGRAGTRWEGARMDEFVKALVSDLSLIHILQSWVSENSLK